MAASLVQASPTYNDVGGGNRNLAFSARPTDGNLVVVFLATQAAIGDPVPTAAAGWVKVGEVRPYEGNKDFAQIWAKRVSAADITAGGALGWQVGLFTSSVWATPCLMGAEFAGVASDTPLATTGSGAVVDAAASSPLQHAQTLAATLAGQLLVMANTVRGFSGTASWTSVAPSAVAVSVDSGFANVRALSWLAAPAAGPATIRSLHTYTNDGWAADLAALFPIAAPASGFAGEPGGGVW